MIERRDFFVRESSAMPVRRVPLEKAGVDLTFAFAMVFVRAQVERHPYSDGHVLTCVFLAPPRDCLDASWSELVMSEATPHQWREMSIDSRRAWARHIISRMVMHEIDEGLVAGDGTRPWDPHKA